MILYLIQSAIALALLICIYFAFLKGSTHFYFNRFYLLGSIVLSLVLPSLALELPVSKTQFVESYEELASFYSSTDYSTDNVIILGKQKATPAQRFSFYFFILSYLIISSYFIIRFSIHLYLLLTPQKEKGPLLNGMQSIFIQQKSHPFSFFHFLFLQKGELASIETNESILLHEKAHSIQKHSIDVLFIELLNCFLWFNPILLLYKKAIKENHEFLADQYAIAQHSNYHQYQSDLLGAIQIKPSSPLTSSFSYLTIKNRLKMMHKQRPTLMQKSTRIAFSLALAGSILLICSFKPIAFESQYNSLELKLESTTPSLLPISPEQITALRSHFGMRTNPYTKKEQMHTGIDMSAPEGASILATADGIIEVAIFSNGYGNHIKIKHDDTYQTMYAHLKSLSVKKGQYVKAGEVIGVIGNTGKSLGRHLHYEVIKNDEKVNPTDYFQYEVQEK